MSGRAHRVAAIVSAVALAAAALALLLPTRPTPRRHGDRDKASDCWARADGHGHRHCAR